MGGEENNSIFDYFLVVGMGEKGELEEKEEKRDREGERKGEDEALGIEVEVGGENKREGREEAKEHDKSSSPSQQPQQPQEQSDNNQEKEKKKEGPSILFSYPPNKRIELPGVENFCFPSTPCSVTPTLVSHSSFFGWKDEFQVCTFLSFHFLSFPPPLTPSIPNLPLSPPSPVFAPFAKKNLKIHIFLFYEMNQQKYFMVVVFSLLFLGLPPFLPSRRRRGRRGRGEKGRCVVIVFCRRSHFSLSILW